ncbi:endonuclease/exonuclease/phosphatase family protein [Pseudobacteriovorax antillogorgiicola]|uniref:Metal-dependent hydrolase, endonuclease/exonuclease/phosphatase family n=1 Tax=Pseudobacteriovorax antillogorgiicola TaxID=1513793 RepID=A0A1Y6CRE8_9BACT|nr:endonuclease/exonuclease/phosphatase family protein [Pseudobacteriovorax antillogorgiicola]TCS46197.1 endonuclease/exonuclease/phosphatase family metal-dependent hydrolase [Pseudobacteriovorax antillogorgiicola]SMF70173.1 Metal-dependent hydrolase, endonuclease/exonuclease/phosphatase family [Pseudobacteriovorax antillogorgiicola]
MKTKPHYLKGSRKLYFLAIILAVSFTKKSSAQNQVFSVYGEDTSAADRLIAGYDAEIYPWEGTLRYKSGVQPFKGSQHISWAGRSGVWFGGGIQSDQPLDLSDYGEGYIQFHIKTTLDVDFRVGVTDRYGNAHYVVVPLGASKYGDVQRDRWSPVRIPVRDIRGIKIDLRTIRYAFAITSITNTYPKKSFNLAVDEIVWVADGGKVTLPTPPTSGGDTTAKGGDLRVMTFNVRTELANDPGERSWNARRYRVSQYIKDSRPDVLGIQEATGGQHDFIRSQIGSQYGSSPRRQIIYRRDRLRIRDSGRIYLVADKWGNRSAEWLEFEVKPTGQRFVFVASHWGVDRNSQQGSANIMRDALGGINGNWRVPTIFVGDLNVQPGSRPLTTLLDQTPLKNFFWGSTFNAWYGANIQLDYVTGHRVSKKDCFVERSHNSFQAPSDHRGIVCNLRF